MLKPKAAAFRGPAVRGSQAVCDFAGWFWHNQVFSKYVGWADANHRRWAFALSNVGAYDEEFRDDLLNSIRLIGTRRRQRISGGLTSDGGIGLVLLIAIILLVLGRI